MTTFDDRERGFEAAFAHDEEMHFRAIARRNHDIGLWAAAKLGMTGADAEAYAKSIVTAGVAKAGDDVIISKIEGDLRASNVALDRVEIKSRMAQLLSEAVLSQRTVTPPVI